MVMVELHECHNSASERGFDHRVLFGCVDFQDLT